MQKQPLGNSGLQITSMGLGTWAIGGDDWKFGWGPQDEREATGAILRAVELGINWIDTAAVYGGGQSELLVGQALRGLPSHDRPLVATKCTRIMQPDGSIKTVMKRESIMAECEASLDRLGVDAIDLYQLHWPLPEDAIEEGWQALVDLKTQGKVRCIGVSNFNRTQLERVQAVHAVASLQPPYNLLNRDVEDELLRFCAQQQIGVIVYSPMAKGLLTGAMTHDRIAHLADSDHRAQDPAFHGDLFEVNLAFADALRPIAERHGRTLAQLAIAWVLRRPEVTAAIVGARRPEQIEETASAAAWQLPPQDLSEIERLLSERNMRLSEMQTH